ncbi:MAG: hypothetical protein AAF628_27870 [Planctomycetota bacterium]
MNRGLFLALAASTIAGADVLTAQGSALSLQQDPTAPKHNAAPGQVPTGAYKVVQAPRTTPNSIGGATQAEPDAGISILVYDDGSINGLAQTAAAAIGTTTVANQFDFNTQLTSGSWDVVVVDCPNFPPAEGWGDMENYVNSGGKAVMSFWDWDVEPGITAAFDCSVSASISTLGLTLFDSGTSSVFSGVTMPNSDWNNNWGDDGDNFNPAAGATGLGHFGTAATPCMVLGNNGNTVASFVIDEAGNTWLGDGSAVQLWENMINEVLGGGGGPTGDILVYDDGTINQLAQTAAANVGPTTVASSYDFNTQLTSQAWDVVVVDCPSTIPTGAWSDLTNYINTGGKVVMGFWDWDNDGGQGDPAMNAAFQVRTDPSLSISTVGLTLFDTGKTSLFTGVPMPNSDWSNNWSDDGDNFQPIIDRATPIGDFGAGDTPSMLMANGGRTICSFVLDEAGNTWLSGGGAVTLWENMIRAVQASDSWTPSTSERVGDPANPNVFFPGGRAPRIGTTWRPFVRPDAGALSTFVMLNTDGQQMNVSTPFGTLLTMPSNGDMIFMTAPESRFSISIPWHTSLAGQDWTAQGGWLDGSVHLGNAIDLKVGY